MSKDSVLARAKKRHALACVQANRIGEAVVLYQKFCEADPDDAEAWFMLGTLYGRLGRLGEAENALRKAVAVDPNFAQAQLTLGQALELQGRVDEAEACFRRALESRPDLADAHDALGRLARLRGDPENAVRYHRRALQFNPQRAVSQLALARALHQLGNLGEAVAAIEQALQLAPDQADAYYDLATVRMGQEQYDEALTAIRRAKQLKPDDIAAEVLEASILERLCDDQGSLATLTPLLERYQEYPESALTYARLCRFTGDYDGAISRLHTLLGRDDLAPDLRARIHFGLGELYDQRGDYGRAFNHFQDGNHLGPLRFDSRAWERRIQRLTQTFDHEALLRAPRAGNCSERPIFIVGMPAAGSALVEHILATYPEAAAAGTVSNIDPLAADFQAILEHTRPANDITQLSREQCDVLAQGYLDRLEQRFPQAMRVTDRQPQNFLHLGVIALLFPMSRIIHCVRDPLDTCLSGYFHESGGDYPYAYRLTDLGAYYRQYLYLMSHWTAVVDLPIFELHYEDLLRQPVKVGRALVEFCGLKWDKGCLKLLKDRRFAAGASLGRWRHYTDHLQTLRQALGGQ